MSWNSNYFQNFPLCFCVSTFPSGLTICEIDEKTPFPPPKSSNLFGIPPNGELNCGNCCDPNGLKFCCDGKPCGEPKFGCDPKNDDGS